MVAALGALFVFVAAAEATPASIRIPEIRFEKYRLANGLTVILSEDHRLPRVAVHVAYLAGAAAQPRERSGLPYLVSLVVYAGSKHVPSSWEVLAEIGATSGTGTGLDFSYFFETLPSTELPAALWVESDRMGFLLDAVDQKKLDVRRSVALAPRPTRPADVCTQLFPAPHPYQGCIEGTASQIVASTLDDVRSFVSTFYTPGNASLVVAGDFNPGVARALIDRYFASIPAGPEVKKLEPQVRQFIAPVKMLRLARDDGELGFKLVWPGMIRPYSEDAAASDVLAAVLGQGRSSRLYRTLVISKAVARDIEATSGQNLLGSSFALRVFATPGHDISEIPPLLQAEIDLIKKDGPSQAEVDEAVLGLISERLMDAEALKERAEMLNRYAIYAGDPGFLAREVEQLRVVTAERVKSFARSRLSDGARIELTIERPPRP